MDTHAPGAVTSLPVDPHAPERGYGLLVDPHTPGAGHGLPVALMPPEQVTACR